MAFKNSMCMVLVFLVIFIAVMSPVVVEGTRVLHEDVDGANHLATYSMAYEKAVNGMSIWLQRLESGPSPQGPGH